MCQLDSDGDGITNAVELLDPNVPGDPRPSVTEYTIADRDRHSSRRPRDPDQCGDNILQGSEDCDGINLVQHAAKIWVTHPVLCDVRPPATSTKQRALTHRRQTCSRPNQTWGLTTWAQEI